MITIISEINDITTSSFVKYCRARGCDVIRINCNINPISFYNQISCISGPIWFRRFFYPKFEEQYECEFNNTLNRYKNKEIQEVISFCFDNLSVFKLGNFKYCRVNKLVTLQIATSVGLKTPEFIITNDYEEIKNFKKSVGEIIVKSSYEPFSGFGFTSFTDLVNIEILKNKNFKFPSFYQKKVDKKIEIRTLFLSDKFYSMAIFSQTNEKTKIDFRNYDYLTPNRLSPIDLPSEIEIKLKALMDKLKLNFGVIDLILSPDNEYHFLEVNPVGQFDDLLRIGNYNIYESILKTLIYETNF